MQRLVQAEALDDCRFRVWVLSEFGPDQGIDDAARGECNEYKDDNGNAQKDRNADQKTSDDIGDHLPSGL